MKRPARGGSCARFRLVKRFYSIVKLTALLGWLPIGICLIAIDFALKNGAREWSDLTFDVVFLTLYLGLVGFGAYLHTKIN